MNEILEETKKCNKPAGYWNKLDNLKHELQPYIEEFNGLPNSGYFKRMNKNYIACGIYRYGGFEKLAQDLNVKLVKTVAQQSNCSVPIGYWQDWNNLCEELKPVIEQYGTLPPQDIIRAISYSLESAIRYHGGFRKVRNRLGFSQLVDNEYFQRPGHWRKIDNVIEALKPFIEEYGTIPSSLILRAKNCGLASAIEKYHGGYVKLRKILKLPEVRRCKKYTGISMYRDWGIQAYGKKCAICEFSFDVDVHHIDGNRLNNQIDNLIVLCPNHHRVIHLLKMNKSEINDYKTNYKELHIKNEYK
jgi:hypothetical protein